MYEYKLPLFTEEQISKLRAEYGKIETIDPCADSYQTLINALNNMTADQLRQIAGAKIRFLSRLATNRLH